MPGGLGVCPFCEGKGVLAFDRGPEVEPCGECGGTGRTYGEPRYRGLFEAIIRDRGVLLDPDMRLLLLGLDALDRRVAALENAARTD